MWQRFTEKARLAVFRAQEAAQRHGANYLGTEHLLIGILRCDSEPLRGHLETLGTSPEALTEALQKALLSGEFNVPSDMTFSPSAKLCIDTAYEAARSQSSDSLNELHLFAGVIQVGSPAIRRAEEELQIDLASLVRKGIGRSPVPAARVSATEATATALSQLLALIDQDLSPAATVLQSLGINLAALRTELTEATKRDKSGD